MKVCQFTGKICNLMHTQFWTLDKDKTDHSIQPSVHSDLDISNRSQLQWINSPVKLMLSSMTGEKMQLGRNICLYHLMFFLILLVVHWNFLVLASYRKLLTIMVL